MCREENILLLSHTFSAEPICPGGEEKSLWKLDQPGEFGKPVRDVRQPCCLLAQITDGDQREMLGSEAA